jgi:hypothetical protein
MPGRRSYGPNREQSLMQVAAAVVGSAAASQVIAPAVAERLDVHAALNTYESPDLDPGVYHTAEGLSVVGSNGRRLIARDQAGSVWIGGCEIVDPRDLRNLILNLTGMADDMERVCRAAADES